MEKQLWDTHIVEHHSIIKRNELLVHAAMRMKLECMMLSKKS